MHNDSEAANQGPGNMDVNIKNRGLLQANSNNADKNIRGKLSIFQELSASV